VIDQETATPRATRDNFKKVDDIISGGFAGQHFDGNREKAIRFVIDELLRRGHRPDYIAALLNDNSIVDSAAQVAKAVSSIDFERDDKQQPRPLTTSNVRIALLKLGVCVRHDEFADKTMVEGLEGHGPVLDDKAVRRLWILSAERFYLQTRKELFYEVVLDTAQLNKFHPVRDYLDTQEWDGVERICRWLTTYLGVEPSPYSAAVGRIVLIAAVRRIREPGSKFDEMLVLESAQGKEKSTALAILAGKDEWFTDSLQLDADGKTAIEMLQGKWIVEVAELQGMKKGEVERLKAFLSRRFDRGRMAYGRLQIEYPRQCVPFGTTNSSAYLRDTTGNRRYWPVKAGEIDLKALRRDRDQLWAEAAAMEAKGESIRLNRELWADAGAEQRKRLADDPIYEALDLALDGKRGKISADKIWDHLRIEPARATPDQVSRVREAMTRLGWEKPSSRQISIGGRKVIGWVKGDAPWEEASLDAM